LQYIGTRIDRQADYFVHAPRQPMHSALVVMIVILVQMPNTKIVWTTLCVNL